MIELAVSVGGGGAKAGAGSAMSGHTKFYSEADGSNKQLGTSRLRGYDVMVGCSCCDGGGSWRRVCVSFVVAKES